MKTNQKRCSVIKCDLWSPDETYTNHRIPGMIVTNKGTLLVYCEARRQAGDWAPMDIFVQRSVDHGKTFGPKEMLAQGTEIHPTVNNPVMVQDSNGRIHFLYCEDYATGTGRALRRVSDDDGLTWSEPIDITQFTKPQYRNAFAFGPGHGIKMHDGTLVIPCWMVPKRFQEPITFHKPSEISTFYSKDNGETWCVGELLCSTSEVVNPNETTACLTSNGSVYLNVRQLGTHRAKAYSTNGYSDWQGFLPDLALPDPRCFGSVVSIETKEHGHVLLFANCACQTERKEVTIRASFDDGKTWPISHLIDAERGGYVEIAANQKDQKIFLLYENNKGETDHFVSFPVSFILKSE